MLLMRGGKLEGVEWVKFDTKLGITKSAWPNRREPGVSADYPPKILSSTILVMLQGILAFRSTHFGRRWKIRFN
jgi:hypothetical protein